MKKFRFISLCFLIFPFSSFSICSKSFEKRFPLKDSSSKVIDSPKQVFKDLKDHCNPEVLFLNGHGGQSKVEILTIKNQSFWRGGLGSTDLIQCIKIVKEKSNQEKKLIRYSCKILATN